MVTPRTRNNQIDRDRRKVDSHVGKEAYPETCPRCGWACTHLTKVFWDSPWNAYGGICTQCIIEACAVFDRDGWPHDPRDDVLIEKPKPEAEPAKKLFD